MERKKERKKEKMRWVLSALQASQRGQQLQLKYSFQRELAWGLVLQNCVIAVTLKHPRIAVKFWLWFFLW